MSEKLIGPILTVVLGICLVGCSPTSAYQSAKTGAKLTPVKVSGKLTILRVKLNIPTNFINPGFDSISGLGFYFPTEIGYRTKNGTLTIKLRRLGDGNSDIRFVGGVHHPDKGAFDLIQNGGGYDGGTISNYYIQIGGGSLVRVSGNEGDGIKVLTRDEENDLREFCDHPLVEADFEPRPLVELQASPKD